VPVSASGVDQEGERERTTAEVSKVQTASKPGADLVSGRSLGDTCLPPRWCPACRWRELGLGLCMERGNLSSRKSSLASGWGREGELQGVVSLKGLSTGGGAQGRTVSQ
jgi:hypothetical protein